MFKPVNLSLKNKKFYIIVFALIFSVLLVWAYIYKNTYYVVVRFNELGALTKNMAAYYNGFKVGKIVRIDPDADFKHTIVRINLIHKKLGLPQNTTVKVESFPSGELYLQFVYPKSPSLKPLKTGDVLEGIATYSLEEFMLGQNISGVTDIVSIHVLKALNATEIANQEIQAFFRSSSKLIQENNEEINQAIKNTAVMTKNLAQMAGNLNKASENLSQTSQKINQALDEKAVRDTILNTKDTTQNLSKATEDIDLTMKKIDETIAQVNETAENLNSITTGLKQTLSQRFAGMRIMFGKPLQKHCEVRNACK